jgi:KDO2-lipid IV(A) lauroyltransferase
MAVQRRHRRADALAAQVGAASVDVVAGIHRNLPTGMVRALAQAAGAAACWSLVSRRRVVEENVRRLTLGLDGRERAHVVRRTFENFAVCTADMLALPGSSRESLLRRVSIDGLTHLDEAVSRGRGVIVVTAHLGNWELGGAALAALGYPTEALVEAIGPARDAAMARCRAATGLHLIPLGPSATRQAIRALRAGRVLAVAGDRALGGSPRRIVAFANGRREVPTGPAWLTLETGAPVVTVRIVRARTGIFPYHATVDPQVRCDELGDAPVAALTDRIAARLSAAVLDHPDQWFVFQPGWLDGREG